MTTDAYVLEEHPVDLSAREFWVNTDGGVRHTLEFQEGLDRQGSIEVVWSSESRDRIAWESRSAIEISLADARFMISALSVLVAEAEEKAMASQH
ncbi:hypothetical protein [Streptomyces sp. NPDC018045]|uniref:hypothetical protein n=1 Tax=Streptomyces sp. NPDC018045 TaxID=3365037 RepID=UPI0037A6E96E